MNNDISCLNPTIIRNPALLRLLRVYRKYVYPDGAVHYVTDIELARWTHDGFGSLFNPLAYGVTKENMDGYAVVDDTGVLIPMFLLVPCGKCKICRYKKSLEWKCRCCAESACSVSIPLFFTLTYDEEHINEAGLCKRDVQLFMKRLRINLKKKGYDSSHLRYFIVGEYGHNTHRPHYHGLFWNFPYMHRLIDKIEIIHDSWQNGFTMVSPARDLSGSYCMKYMQKPPIKPKNKESEFYLCSRGRGSLGAKWLKENEKIFLDNPNLNTVKIKCADGVIREFPMPLYYRRKLFKTLCQLVPLDVRKDLDQYCVASHCRSIVAWYCFRAKLSVKSQFDFDEKIFTYFRPYGLCDPDLSYEAAESAFSWLNKDCKRRIYNKEWLEVQFAYYDGLCSVYSDSVLNFMKDTPTDYLDKCLALTEKHKNFVDKACELCTHLSTADYLFKIENILSKSLQKEIF